MGGGGNPHVNATSTSTLRGVWLTTLTTLTAQQPPHTPPHTRHHKSQSAVRPLFSPLFLPSHLRFSFSSTATSLRDNLGEDDLDFDLKRRELGPLVAATFFSSFSSTLSSALCSLSALTSALTLRRREDAGGCGRTREDERGREGGRGGGCSMLEKEIRACVCVCVCRELCSDTTTYGKNVS